MTGIPTNRVLPKRLSMTILTVVILVNLKILPMTNAKAALMAVDAKPIRIVFISEASTFTW